MSKINYLLCMKVFSGEYRILLSVKLNTVYVETTANTVEYSFCISDCETYQFSVCKPQFLYSIIINTWNLSLSNSCDPCHINCSLLNTVLYGVSMSEHKMEEKRKFSRDSMEQQLYRHEILMLLRKLSLRHENTW